MTDKESKQILVILSPGRSGTSLLMNVLGAMGISLSENLVAGNYANPEGHFEDKNISEIHKKIFSNLNAHPYIPLPNGWLDKDVIEHFQPKLLQIVIQQLTSASTTWGFKDPRTCTLLPLWFRVMNPQRIVPKFILAIRNPSSTIASFIKQYNDLPSLSELAWLTRTTDALHHTAADCYIVNYEDWFTRPTELSQGLLKYSGLDQYFSGDVDETIKDLIKPNLNRSVYEDYQVQNEYVLKLYDVLKDCRGADFDRFGLMAVVKDCLKAMDGFKGWYLAANKYISRENELRKKLDARTKTGERDNRIKEMEVDLQKMVFENNRLLMESKGLFDEVENSRKQLTAIHQHSQNHQNKPTDNKQVKTVQTNLLSSSDGQLKKWKKAAIVLEYSYSFRLGQILINAFTMPGKNTLLMPYYLAKLVWDIVSGKGREQLRKAIERIEKI